MMSANESFFLAAGQNPETTPAMQPRLAGPTSGDVLVSQPTARADRYEISVLPSEAHIIATRYQEALQKVRELARRLTVDGWYTADHTHFVRIASHRV